jgi:membrane-anchored protein YejM (alkaline phosphatase superfamily)
VKGEPPANSARAESLTASIDELRNDFRRRANERFMQQRRTAETDVYTESYEQALQLMEKRDVFDLSKEPDAEHERYGKHDFGQHCLMARRMLENDVPFVQVQHSNYDTHHENFNFHIEQLGEFDRPFATLVGDLSDRGMLETTLVVVMTEFGRTPKINSRYGRDHWGASFSICLGGAKVHPGAVIGATNENGTAVSDREVNHGDLFHTYLAAVGLNSSGSFDFGGRDVPMADPAHGPISELIT